MGGYPPGMGYRDKVRAGIIEPHHHECEFRPIESDPIIEDDAAIFVTECNYVEGEYGQGWSCEETRSTRFELSWVEKKKRGDEPNIRYHESELDHFWLVAEDALIEVESDNGEVVDLNPNPEGGYVRAESENWIAKFE